LDALGLNYGYLPSSKPIVNVIFLKRLLNSLQVHTTPDSFPLRFQKSWVILRVTNNDASKLTSRLRQIREERLLKAKGRQKEGKK
jgi:hypothetical protein